MVAREGDGYVDKEAAWGTILNAASSGAARYIRYQSMAAGMPEEEREAFIEKKMENFGIDTLTYMGAVGQMVNVYSMSQRAIEEKDFSPMGLMPAVSYAENMAAAAKAPFSDDSTADNLSKYQKAMSLGTISYTNFLFNTIRQWVDDEE